MVAVAGWAFGAGKNPGFSPSNVANMLAWYRADQGVTSSSGLVSSWADQSGAGDSNRNALNGGAGKPTLNSSNGSYNNQATIDFTAGSSTKLTTGTWSVAPVSQPATVLLVAHKTSGAQQTFYDNIVSAEFCQLENPLGQMEIFAGTALRTSTTVTSPAVWAGVYNGNSSALYKNNHTTAIVSGAAGSNTLSGLIMGCDFASDAVTFFTGSIASLLVYGRALTTAELGLLFTYLGGIYGIATT